MTELNNAGFFKTKTTFKVYLASGLENIERAKEVIQRLEEEGFTITYNWTTHGRLYAEDDLTHVAVLEEAGVKNCDVILVLLPGGSGTHFEFGLARGTNKQIILLEEVEVKQSSFYYLPGIHKTRTLDGAISILKKLEKHA